MEGVALLIWGVRMVRTVVLRASGAASPCWRCRNLEPMGAILDNKPMALAAKRGRLGLSFSEEGLSELRDMHGHLTSIAYAILEAVGEWAESRWRARED